MQVCTIGGNHTCTGSCICTKRESDPGRDNIVVKPACPAKGDIRVACVAFSPDAARVVSCGSLDHENCDEGLVKMWDVETGAQVSALSDRVVSREISRRINAEFSGRGHLKRLGTGGPQGDAQWVSQRLKCRGLVG